MKTEAQTPLPLLNYTLGEGVKAFTTTRNGGVSEGQYATFNINPYCNDNAEHVEHNRALLASALEIDANQIVMAHQCHDIEVRAIAQDFFELPQNIRQMVLEGVDALTTNLVNVCIGVSTADCIPILIYDPEHRAVGAIHAGWRGTVKRIVLKTIASMRAHYGSLPHQLHAIVGPGIAVEAFEVGNEVAEAFQSAGFQLTSIGRKQEKWHIDLPKCNTQQLLAAGLKAENIVNTNLCTYTHNTDFFSARRQGIDSGRMFSGIMLQNISR